MGAKGRKNKPIKPIKILKTVILSSAKLMVKEKEQKAKRDKKNK